MSGDAVLAVDLGTSNVKAAVLRPDGTVAGTGEAPIRLLASVDGAAEQDPDQVWEATVAACREAVGATEGAGAEVGAVSVCSQYSSIVPVDAHGRPTMNMVAWLDARGDLAAMRPLAGGERVKPSPLDLLRWVRVHGIPPLESGIDSLSHMRWVKYARPEAYARTATFLEPMDYLTSRMTGRVSATQCSSFMMLVTDNRHPDHTRYAPALVARSNIDPAKLPPLVDVNEPLGTVTAETAEALGVPADAVVYPGINDTQAGAIGSGAFRGDEAGLSIGTTTVIVTGVAFKRTDIRNSIVTMPSPLPGDYLVMAEGGIGGKALDHFLEHLVFGIDRFGDHHLEDRFTALHAAIDHVPPGSGGVLFLPWLGGSQTPREDRQVRGGFLNLSLEHTREHLARAVLEGVAFNLRWIRDAVERFSKRRVTAFRFYGGGGHSALWAQIIADVTDRPVQRLADPAYTTCRGVGLFGLVRSGQLRLDDVLDLVPVADAHEPDPALHEVYETMFTQFVRAFERNRPIFHALNG